MAKSDAVRAEDVRAVVRLVGECRDLGDNPRAWREHFFRELGRLVDAPVAVGGEQGGFTTGRPRDLGTYDVGWENGFDRAGWVAALAEGQKDPTTAVVQTALLAAAPPPEWVMIPRRAVVPDAVWYQSDDYHRSAEAMGTDAHLYCFEPIAGTGGDEVSGVILMRAAGEPDFGRRERVVVREAHAAIAALVGGPLARLSDPSPSALPPRARAVLRCLLEGDSDKQIAARLGVSRNVVNQAAKLVFRHFNAGSRAELLARWVRRGYGNRFPWADPPAS